MWKRGMKDRPEVDHNTHMRTVHILTKVMLGFASCSHYLELIIYITISHIPVFQIKHFPSMQHV